MTEPRTTVNGIACPACKRTQCTVMDSRPQVENSYVRRRRRCEGCGLRFTTHERLVTDNEEQQDRLALFDAIMAQSQQLEALARSIMPPQVAARLPRRAQAGAVAIQAALDEEAWVNRLEIGRPWREEMLSNPGPGRVHWSLVSSVDGIVTSRVTDGSCLVSWTGPGHPMSLVWWNEEEKSFNGDGIGILMLRWELEQGPHNSLARVRVRP